MKKYELTDITITHKDKTLHRIKAIKDFRNIKAGTLGGFVESEDNLSHYGNCWLFDDSKVYDKAEVRDDAAVYNHAEVSRNAKVYNSARVSGNSLITDNVLVYGDAFIHGRAVLINNVRVFDSANVYDAIIKDDVILCKNADVVGPIVIGYDAIVKDLSDYLVFKNCISSGRYFTWTKSNDMWQVGCFYGTGEELVKKAFEDDYKKGIFYQSAVDYVENLKKLHIL